MYLNTVQSFDEYGHLPNGLPCAKLLYSSNYKKLNPYYKSLMDELQYRKNMTDNDIRKSSLYSTLALFFLEMKMNGASVLDNITEKSVLTFFSGGKRKGSNTTQDNLKLALKKYRIYHHTSFEL